MNGAAPPAGSATVAGLETEAPCPGVLRRALRSERATIAEHAVEPGAPTPMVPR